MNSTKPWILEKNGIRPAGKSDECFYCHCKVGEEHKTECVIRQRSVVIKFAVDLVVLVPEDWKQEDIEYRYNDSTWCANNLVTMLASLEKRLEEHNSSCICNFVSATYRREATSKDEQLQLMFVDQVER